MYVKLESDFRDRKLRARATTANILCIILCLFEVFSRLRNGNCVLYKSRYNYVTKTDFNNAYLLFSSSYNLELANSSFEVPVFVI